MEKRRLSFDQDRSMIRCLPGGSLLPTSRSQGVRLQPAGINDEEMLICGGYNKELGTLDTIERYSMSKDKM
jgi:hypothetical protein